MLIKTEPETVELWNKVWGEMWVDSDGDIGLLDTHDYSIMMSPRGAKQLRDWLNSLDLESP